MRRASSRVFLRLLRLVEVAGVLRGLIRLAPFIPRRDHRLGALDERAVDAEGLLVRQVLDEPGHRGAGVKGLGRPVEHRDHPVPRDDTQRFRLFRFLVGVPGVGGRFRRYVQRLQRRRARPAQRQQFVIGVDGQR